MGTSTIDYDAIAKQFGGISSGGSAAPPPAVDYEAIARQFGGTSSPASGSLIHLGTPLAAPSSIQVRAPLSAPPDPNQPPASSAASKPEAKTFEGFVENLGHSLYQNVISPVVHPRQSLEGVTNLLEGMSEKSGFAPVMGQPRAPAIDALVELYKKRYGSMQGFVDAWYKDPVGMAMDLSAVAGGAGIARSAAQDFLKVAGLGDAAEAVQNALGKTAAATKGAVTGGIKAVPGAIPGAIGYGAAGSLVFGPEHFAKGVTAGLALGIRKGVQAGMKAAVEARDSRLATEAAAEAAARGEGFLDISGSSLDKSATAQPQPAPLPPSRGLPAPAIVTPASADTSFVRAVPAQYPEVEPGFQRPTVAPAAAATPALSFDDLAHSLTGKSPSKLTVEERASVQNVYDRITKGVQPENTPPVAPQEAPVATEPAAPTPEPPAASIAPEAPQPAAQTLAQQLENEMRVKRLTDYAIRKQIPANFMAGLGPEEWKMIADDAGTRAPTADEIAQIRQNVSGRTVETPAQGEQIFQEQKARTEGGTTPPDEETPPAAPGAGTPEKTPPAPPAAPAAGIALQPLSGEVPPHYQSIQQIEGTSAATRAFLKDQRIADYLLKQGVTPEQFEAMPLADQNRLIVKAPAASAKGRNRPFLPRPEGAAPRSIGRWAEEGIQDIANTMRWRQAQTPAAGPAAPEVATLPPETAQMAPAEAEAAFQEQKVSGQTPPPRPVKQPAAMSAAEINRRLDQLDKKSTQLTDRMIKAGRGNERPSEYAKKNDPLSSELKALYDERTRLHIEMELRYGPSVPSRLPRGFGPRK